LAASAVTASGLALRAAGRGHRGTVRSDGDARAGAARPGACLAYSGDQGETLSICGDLADLMELRLRLEVCEQAEGSLKGGLENR
jgi:hypothetical protein